MKAKDKLKEFRGMVIGDLRTAVASTEEELLKLRFRHAAGQLEQTAQIKSLKKTIARGRTILKEKVVDA